MEGLIDMRKEYNSPEFILKFYEDVICTSGDNVELDYTFGDSNEEMYD